MKKNREARKISQRSLASLAGISYKTVQLLEAGQADPKISTLQNIAKALGYPGHIIEHRIESLWRLPQDSIAVISERICEEGEDSWKLWLFNFVDAYRQGRDRSLLEAPPCAELSNKIKALLASTVESLCGEGHEAPPPWCGAVGGLPEPWFVSGIENLKASALVESPVYFRKRNIFVLENFLKRA